MRERSCGHSRTPIEVGDEAAPRRWWSCCCWYGPTGAPAVNWGSATVRADSMQTMLCAYLSVIVLVGSAAQRRRPSAGRRPTQPPHWSRRWSRSMKVWSGERADHRALRRTYGAEESDDPVPRRSPAGSAVSPHFSHSATYEADLCPDRGKSVHLILEVDARFPLPVVSTRGVRDSVNQLPCWEPRLREALINGPQACRSPGA